jgi:type I restriction enzyme S subunit
VLKWAFEGKLTNSLNYDSNDLHDEHDLNIAAEPEVEYKIEGNHNNQKNHSSDKGELPEGWKWVRIEEATISLDNKRKPINKDERKKRQGNIPYYGANGRVGWIDDYIFDEPLVCVVEDETFTGREIPFSYKISGKTWVNNHAHVLKPKDGLNIDFLNYQLFYYPFLRLTTGTTGRKKLTKNALSNAPIKICSIKEQQLIVQEIESRLSVADKMEESITESLQQAETLKQSILKKAFEGKLI